VDPVTRRSTQLCHGAMSCPTMRSPAAEVHASMGGVADCRVRCGGGRARDMCVSMTVKAARARARFAVHETLTTDARPEPGARRHWLVDRGRA
jgi:hypothetical protein